MALLTVCVVIKMFWVKTVLIIVLLVICSNDYNGDANFDDDDYNVNKDYESTDDEK